MLPKFLRKIGKRPPIKTGCFQAGTLVDTPDGKIEIQDLEVGDWVWAYDFNSDQHVARRIEHLIPAKTKAWVHLHTDAGEIVATPGHDFWVVTEERWIDAQELLPEMGLLRSDGKITYIISLDFETLEVEEPTYNFEVEDDHNYYVGDSGVLVHNIDCDVAKEIGILRDAASKKGNYSLGNATTNDANKLGVAWVGKGARWSSNGKALVSKDGLRQYRPPSYKPRQGGWQANFERRFPGQKSKKWQANGHLNITE